MEHGCMVMTLRLSSSHHSGIRQIHPGQKKCIKFAAMSSPCWWFFSNIQGIVHKESVPPGQTTHGKIYCEVLKWLREGIWCKRPDKWKKNNWFLHHDNAPAHTSLVRQFLTSKNITVIPPYSPDLTPATFSYSPRWNYGWKGVVLTQLRISMQKRKWLSTHSHLRNSRDAWNHEKHAGIAAYMPKGTTSKEMVETRSYGKKLFMVKYPKFLGSPTYINHFFEITYFKSVLAEEQSSKRIL